MVRIRVGFDFYLFFFKEIRVESPETLLILTDSQPYVPKFPCF